MGIRRTITVMASTAALALGGLPMVAPVAAAPLGVESASHWYEGRTGTVRWAIGDEFLEQLTGAGATMTFCSAAKMSVVSGVNVATMPVRGNSLIRLNAKESGVDAVADCTVTITGNGTTVELTSLYFSAASGYPSGMSATINDEYTEIASGASKRLPKQATNGRIAVISPVLVTVSAFSDILRGQQRADGGYDGPVPTMTTEAVTLGLFQLVLKVKSTSRPQDPHNSEG